VINNYVELRKGTVIGENCYIDSGVCVTGDAIIGNNVTIRNKCVIARGSKVGDRTFIAPQAMFNNLDTEGTKIGGADIGKDCWIGTNVTFQHGVKICDNVVVGAKALVQHDITESGTYLGIPAKRCG